MKVSFEKFLHSLFEPTINAEFKCWANCDDGTYGYNDTAPEDAEGTLSNYNTFKIVGIWKKKLEPGGFAFCPFGDRIFCPSVLDHQIIYHFTFVKLSELKKSRKNLSQFENKKAFLKSRTNLIILLSFHLSLSYLSSFQ